jgi:hypothetical protein
VGIGTPRCETVFYGLGDCGALYYMQPGLAL